MLFVMAVVALSSVVIKNSQTFSRANSTDVAYAISVIVSWSFAIFLALFIKSRVLTFVISLAIYSGVVGGIMKYAQGWAHAELIVVGPLLPTWCAIDVLYGDARHMGMWPFYVGGPVYALFPPLFAWTCRTRPPAPEAKGRT